MALKMERISFKFEPIPNLVSIIIPTHNRSGLLRETLVSIENQKYDRVEIIVVDDHSVDNTREIVEQFASDSRFEVLYLQSQNRGGNSARNIGIINSKGAFIQFFDDDDLVNSDFLISRISLFGEQNVDYIACDFDYFKDDICNIVGSKNISAIKHDIVSHLYYTSLPTPCFLVKRETIARLGLWNERIKKLQDLAYFQRFFKQGLKGLWIDKSLFKVRVHDNNVSHQIDEYSRIMTWEAVNNEWKGNTEYKRVSLVCMCHMCFCLKKLFSARKYFKVIVGSFFILYHHPLLLINYLRVSKMGRVKDNDFIELLYALR